MTTFLLTLKSSFRGIYLISYSVILPIILFVGLGLYIDSYDYQLQLLAGMIGISIIFWGMVTNSFTIYQQRLQGVYKLFKITPMSFTKFLIGTISAWMIVSLILAILLIISGLLMFSLEIDMIQIGFIMLFVIIGNLIFTLIGFIIAFISRSINQVSMISNIVALPLIGLSQAFYSLNNLPQWLQIISAFNPFQYFVKGMQEIFLANYNNAFVSLSILLIVTTMLLVLTNMTYNKKLFK